jgi:branched-chain amino acid transport system ATP-binding protein
MMVALQTEGLVKRYGALLVTDHVSLDIRPGELHAVIGPNGAGKTTLINQLSGELRPDEGRVRFDGQDVTALAVHGRARSGLMRSYQITSIFEEFSVLENAVLAALAAKRHAWQFWRPMLGDTAARAAADEAIAAAGLSAQSGVAAQPRFLLLDEPMAGMSVQESASVTELLRGLKGRYTILLVEHDMDAVFSLADRITVLVYGSVMFTGTPDEIREHPEVRAVYLGEETI